MTTYQVTAADLDRALRAVLNEADYDLHKAYESDEMTGEDTYHELVAVAERELADQEAAPVDRWWITTEILARDGEKVLGPFESRELALNVRAFVEVVRAPRTYYVDREAQVSPA